MIQLVNKKYSDYCYIGYDSIYNEYVMVVPMSSHEAYYTVAQAYYETIDSDVSAIKTLVDAISGGANSGADFTYLGGTSADAPIADANRWNDPRYNEVG